MEWKKCEHLLGRSILNYRKAHKSFYSVEYLDCASLSAVNVHDVVFFFQHILQSNFDLAAYIGAVNDIFPHVLCPIQSHNHQCWVSLIVLEHFGIRKRGRWYPPETLPQNYKVKLVQRAFLDDSIFIFTIRVGYLHHQPFVILHKFHIQMDIYLFAQYNTNIYIYT